MVITENAGLSTKGEAEGRQGIEGAQLRSKAQRDRREQNKEDQRWADLYQTSDS